MSGKLNDIKTKLTKAGKIVGISFSDTSIYCSLSDEAKGGRQATIIEQALPQGLIVNGEIINEKEVGILLKKLLLKINTRISFCIISIPSSLIFSNIIHLPTSAEIGDSLDKAIQLILKVELPWDKDNAYTDYINHGGDKNISISIFSGLKSILQKYIFVSEYAGVKVLAIEFDALSTLRLMKKHDEPTLSLTATEDSANIIITYKDRINFLFSIKSKNISGKEFIENEVLRIKNYYANETGEAITLKETNLELEPDSIELLGDNISNISAYPSLGASLRRESSEGKDSNISLLHISPNELFRYYKYISSLGLIKQLVIFISLILIFVHVLFFYTLASIAERNSVFSSRPPKIYSNVLEMEQETNQLAQVINMGGLISDQTHRFLPRLLKVDGIFTEGIYVGSISTPTDNAPIVISGSASTRQDYNTFRKSLSEQSGITIVNFPLGNLNLQTSIPFSVSLYIKEI